MGSKLVQPVFHRTKKEAEGATGYFRVNTLQVTDYLFRKLERFIRDKALVTWTNKNKAGTYRKTWTLRFGLISSLNSNAAVFLVQNGGRDGDKWNDESVLERLQDETPTLNQLYHWIVVKYRDDIIAMDYSTVAEPDFATVFGGRGAP